MKKIAVLVETSTTWGRKICSGIQQYAAKKGSWMIFLDPRGIMEKTTLPEGWNGDGIITRISDTSLATNLQRLKIPVVNVSSMEIPGKRFPRVCNDIPAFGRMAFQYFKSRGFQNYAFFTLVGLNHMKLLEEAFTDQIRGLGFTYSSYSIPSQEESEPPWGLRLEELSRWLKSLPKPVAILTWNAGCGRTLLYASQNAGLLVPEEVSILSCAEDDLLCATAPIPISGIDAPLEKIGFKAAQLLDQLIEKKKKGTPVHLFEPLGILSRRSSDTLAIADATLVKAIQYIRAKAHRPLSVNTIALHVGVSRRVLERKFKSCFGRSPGSEIRRIRMEKARNLLIATNLSTEAISEATGFCTLAYFSQDFKKTFGIPPLKYRQKFRSL